MLMGRKSFKSKTKGPQTNLYPFFFKKYCKSFQLLTRKKKGFNESVHDFSVDYNTIDTSNIVDINKYFMKNYVMLGFIKQTYIVLVLVLLDVGGSRATKSSISMNNQRCMVTPALADLNPGECITIHLTLV